MVPALQRPPSLARDHARCPVATERSLHEIGEQLMEVVRADFPPLGVAATVIESRANPALNGFDNLLVLHFHSMQSGPDATLAEAGIPNVREKRDFCSSDAQWCDNVELKS